MGDFDRLSRQIVESVHNDDDDEAALALMAATLLLRKRKRGRNPKSTHPRIVLADHFSLLHANDPFEFQRRYHVSFGGYKELVRLLYDELKVDARQSMRSTSGNRPISPDDIVAMGLRFLGGTSAVDLTDLFGVSLASAHRVINKFIAAVNRQPALSINMPRTRAECKKLADEWDERSNAHGIFYGVVGAVDGILIHTQKPRKDEVSDTNQYFSGHKHHFGLNVQCVCDARGRFIYVCVAGPGKTNDARAFPRCEKLQRVIDNFPPEYFLVGDGAYPLSHTMLVPFNKHDRMDEDKRNFNFFHNQHRIQVECTFGQFTKKWAIFQKPSPKCLKRVSAIWEAAARLHNFNINYNDGNWVAVPNNDGEGEGGQEPPTDDVNENIPTYDYYSNDNGRRRNAIFRQLMELGLERPEANVQRNIDVPELNFN